MENVQSQRMLKWKNVVNITRKQLKLSKCRWLLSSDVVFFNVAVLSVYRKYLWFKKSSKKCRILEIWMYAAVLCGLWSERKHETFSAGNFVVFCVVNFHLNFQLISLLVAFIWILVLKTEPVSSANCHFKKKEYYRTPE